MTEYMPTTEEVRRCYGDIHCSDLNAGSLEHHECPEEAEFDRWLNEIRAEAWEEGAESAFYDPEIRGLVDYPENPYRNNEK